MDYPIKKWIDMAYEKPPMPIKEEVADTGLPPVRMKRIITGNTYEGKIKWYHQLGYVLRYYDDDSKEYRYFLLSDMLLWEKEIFEPINSRCEILDL